MTKLKEHLTECKNLAYRREERVKELSAEKEDLTRKLEAEKKFCKDADRQIIQLIDQNKKAAKDLQDARDDNQRMAQELVQLWSSLVEKQSLDEKLQKNAEKLTEMEGIIA